MSGPYRTIVADPPWDVKRLDSPGAKGFGAQEKALCSVRLPYTSMSVDEIAGLPVAGMVCDQTHLYLWTINRYVEDAYAVARAWGFRPSTLLVWSKKPMGIGPGGAFSITTEFVVFGVRGPQEAKQRIDRTAWDWPRGRHSAKPDAFLDVVEQVSHGPYLELFARRARFGWDYAGDGSLGTVELPGLRTPGA